MMMLSKIMLSGVLPFSHLEDDEFNMVIYELANGPLKFDETRLFNLKFNPPAREARAWMEPHS